MAIRNLPAAAPRFEVSFIIATRNRATHLRECLARLRALLSAADELIVIDGASTDETRAVVEANLDIITQYESSPDSGESHAYNKGLLRARGEILKWITDDDIIYPAAARQAIGIMLADASADLFVTAGERAVATGDGSIRLIGAIPALLDGVPYYGGNSTWIRRSSLARTGLLDTSFHHPDLDFTMRAYATGLSIRTLEITTYRHILYPCSGMQTFERYRNYDRLRSFLDVPKEWGHSQAVVLSFFCTLRLVRKVVRMGWGRFLMRVADACVLALYQAAHRLRHLRDRRLRIPESS